MQSSRLGRLDTLRGASALVVMIHHLHLPGPQNIPIDLGKFGICMFFLISGFIIPSSFDFGAEKRLGLYQFVVKRVFRLYPAYWASLAVAIATAFLLDQRQSYVTDLVNITMVQNLLGFGNVILVYWTLQFEIIFYTICALLYLYGDLRSARTATTGLLVFLVLGLCMAIVRWYTHKQIPVALPLSLASMFTGYAIRRLSDAGRSFGPLIAVCSFIVGIVPIVYLAYKINVEGILGIPWYAYLCSYSLAALTFYLGIRYLTAEIPSTEYIGRISYSIYLFHVPVIAWVDAYLLKSGGQTSQLARTAAVTAATLALASASYFVFEQPGIDLGRKLLRLRSQRRPLKPIEDHAAP
jgi:peptidoglycan/LPS O-acetylase OafA/YrhL